MGNKGVQFIQPAEARLVDLPVPVLKEGQVRVRIRAASLNYRDLLIYRGLYSKNLPYPFVPLSDGAGEILELGSGGHNFRPGDRVALLFMPDWQEGPLEEHYLKRTTGAQLPGVLQEEVCINPSSLIPIPDHLSFEEAATLPCAALTAWNALQETGNLKQGETLLTLGTGGVSLFALQFAHALGSRVVITSSSYEKLERARQLGADATMNYRTTPDWDQRIREWNHGEGVDQVIEVGGSGTLERSVRSVKAAGTISLIGVLAEQAPFNPIQILMRAIRLQGIFVGSRAMFERMNRFLEANKIHPVIDRIYPIERFHDALEDLAQGRHFGKIVLTL